MGATDSLRTLDDKVLGDRFRRRRVSDGDEAPRGDGLPKVLAVVWKVSRAVLLVLAAVVLLGIVFTKAPTNAHNVIVRNALRLARDAAGPFKDVFAPKDPEDALVANYLVAAGVYLVLAVVVGKLPTSKR